MRSKYIFYFHDNKLQYTKKDEIKTYEFSIECLQYGKIINIELFIKELKRFIKKEKIITIISPSILIITPYNFYNTDQEILLMAFNSLGINKIEFKKEIEYYPNKANAIILNIHETYLIETKITNYHLRSLLYPFNLFKDKNELIKIISSKNKASSYLLIGTNKYVPEFVELFKKQDDKNIHYYNNHKTYIIDQVKKNLQKKG